MYLKHCISSVLPWFGSFFSYWRFPTLCGGQILEKENAKEPSVTSVWWEGGGGAGCWLAGILLLGNEVVSQPIHLGTINISVSWCLFSWICQFLQIKIPKPVGEGRAAVPVFAHLFLNGLLSLLTPRVLRLLINYHGNPTLCGRVKKGRECVVWLGQVGACWGGTESHSSPKWLIPLSRIFSSILWPVCLDYNHLHPMIPPVNPSSALHLPES